MITVEINDAEVQAALNGVAAALSDGTAMMNEIGMFLVKQTKDRFPEQVSPDGAAWAPRSAVTLARYKKQGKPFGGILHLSGQMARSIFHDYDQNSVRIGSPEPYAAVQQFGAAQGAFGAFMGKDKKGRDHFHHLPWGNIPARPFLGLSEDDREGILAIISETLAAALES
ncbi:MAG: phage virion morphosis protein [Cypionkella sp.]|uniref:phage virion morphogenesis protein n=1 Tax=Cypionkella sp. TaxID=2811411 RepID=UPI0026313D60|nr:phage virion morphogenesis protein [Cypionkella sp.]MDB5658323.1 phage virion morphosis protein [Cypionkella sp.]